MKRIARNSVTAAVVLIVPMILSSCIVCFDDPWCDRYPERMATLHVYALDYYSGAPITWACVELFENDWWSWDYVGTWCVNAAGHAVLHGGYLHHDGCGGPEEEQFRVVVYASGYCTEAYEIELSYFYPSETLTFYMVPCGGQEEGAPGGSTPETESPEGTGDERAGESGSGLGKVVVGERETD